MEKKLQKLTLLLLSGALLAACSPETEEPTESELEDQTSEVDDVESDDTEETAEEISFHVDIVVDNEALADLSQEIVAEEGEYLLDLMEENYDMDAEDGFVQSIEGHEQDEDEGLFWMYYINEEMAEVGAGEYEPQNNDQVEWKLESFE